MLVDLTIGSSEPLTHCNTEGSVFFMSLPRHIQSSPSLPLILSASSQVHPSHQSWQRNTTNEPLNSSLLQTERTTRPSKPTTQPPHNPQEQKQNPPLAHQSSSSSKTTKNPTVSSVNGTAATSPIPSSNSHSAAQNNG